MNAEQKKIHQRLLEKRLPPKWECEVAWPWSDGTHLIAPERKGGVVVKDRLVTVQLPGDGPARTQVEIGRFYGRGWLDRMVEAANQAAVTYSPEFEEKPHLDGHVEKLGVRVVRK